MDSGEAKENKKKEHKKKVSKVSSHEKIDLETVVKDVIEVFITFEEI
jgi:hypothetical protein